jgi:hypothetical protein
MLAPVPFFSNEQEVYEHLGRLAVELVADPVIGRGLQRANAVVQFRYRDPAAMVTVDVRSDVDPRVILGRTEVEPDVSLAMDADVAHRFWLGEINAAVALARRQIATEGPAWKVLKLLPLVKPAFPRYRAQLEAAGRGDLVAAGRKDVAPA